MAEDGSLILDLRAEGPGGTIGDARVVYAPDHPRYKVVRDHIGDMKPGEARSVPPFPER